MSISLTDLDFLTSDAGARVLRRLAGEDLGDDHTLSLLTALRRDLSPQQAGAALELAHLRQKAVTKFGDDAAKMYFTREALEQASDPLVSKWRASALFLVAWRELIDVCCGIGSDSLTYARYGARVTGIDIDPVRVAMARLNAEVFGAKAKFEVADVREIPIVGDLAFYDPGRRDAQGRRIFDVEQYQPPLSLVHQFAVRAYVVKLSPGVEVAQLAAYRREGAFVDFVSVKGELKEAVLIQDFLLGSYDVATLITENRTYAWENILDEPEAPISQPRGWLIEPDPAIIRARLVADLALELGGAQLDPEIAYITTDAKPNSVWVRAWRILDWMPFNLKKLRAYLREHNVGQVTVKKRGTAVTPEALIAKLKLNINDSGSRTIVLTRCRGEHITLVCDDLTIE